MEGVQLSRILLCHLTLVSVEGVQLSGILSRNLTFVSVEVAHLSGILCCHPIVSSLCADVVSVEVVQLSGILAVYHPGFAGLLKLENTVALRIEYCWNTCSEITGPLHGH